MSPNVSGPKIVVSGPEKWLASGGSGLGLEAGQGLLEGDIVDNLSSGLDTARGAYNFLADLS